MELHISGLRGSPSKQTLETGLQPYMNVLGIEAWSCNDPRQKNFAFITFMHIKDANAFLQHHGAKRPQAPKLSLFGSPIFVARSNNKPDKFVVDHLAYQHDQKAANAVPLPADSTVLPLREISCGHLMFLKEFSENPTFIKQCGKPCNIAATAKFAKKTLILKYDETCRADIPYAAIWDIVIDAVRPVITLILTEVPRFYMSMFDHVEAFYPGLFTSRGPKLHRLDHLGGHPEHKSYAADCLVYQLAFQTSQGHFRQTMESVIKKNQLPSNLRQIQVNLADDTTDFPASLKALTNYMNEITTKSMLPFDILFQVNALVRNNYITPNVARDILGILIIEFTSAKDRGTPPPFSAHSFKPLLGDIPFPVPGIDPQLLTAPYILNQLAGIERSRKDRSPFLGRREQEGTARQSWILKAVVTPARVTFHGPDLETNNRILRKFSDFTEYFLRVQFCEEDGEDLYFNPSTFHDIVLERFKKVFNSGIPVAGRVYGFLGFSHSSLRSHSAWFAAPFFDHDNTLQTHITIIRDLGDFKHIQIPARCAARIGQAFSETPFSIDLQRHGIEHRYIGDVKSADGQRTFSDGVGTISLQAAQVLWRELPNTSNKATCFQIRWAGAKGMLSLDTRLPGKVFCIREESMVKFEGADEAELEICDMSSRPLRMVLNQQMIKIMEDLGIDEAWFFRQQKRELDNLKAVTRSVENTAIFLRIQDVGTTIDLPKFFKRLHKRKIDYRTDQFLRSLVEAVVLRELRLLKHKARIPVKKGVTLFGVMDETGFLEEDEVYITYDRTYQGARGAIDGTLQDGRVTVTRCPALHPGDIQFRYQRTPPPEHPLRALNNCIVFSQKGERDLPSMLSGGDLDGDLYNIIWDPEVVRKRVSDAADYPKVLAQPLGREVNKGDMATFFVDFMKTDQLGIIASRHLILADKKPEGTFDQDCLKLAEMHSAAVDFSKTGIPVDVSKMPNHKSQFRPDLLVERGKSNVPNPQYAKVEILTQTTAYLQPHQRNFTTSAPSTSSTIPTRKRMKRRRHPSSSTTSLRRS